MRYARHDFRNEPITCDVCSKTFELLANLTFTITQEENRILEKTNRQKVLEVEKLSETIKELEEAVLAGGSAANAIRDYQRQITELNVGVGTYVL